MARKTSTSFYLSDEARELLRQLSAKLGISQAAIVEMLVRKFAEQEGVSSEQ